MNKNIIIGIVVVILLAGGVYWFVQSQNSASVVLPNDSTNTPSVTPVTPSSPAVNPSPTPTPTPNPAPVIRNVAIQNFAFSPTSITIKKGDTVVWTNKDSVTHNVIGSSGGPSSSSIGAGETYSFTFNNVGTFSYHCSIHPSMVGTVVVTQ